MISTKIVRDIAIINSNEIIIEDMRNSYRFYYVGKI